MEWIEVLREFGFPVAISLILLFRFEKAIANLQKAVYKSTENMQNVIQQLGEIIRADKGIHPGPIHLHRRASDAEPKKNGDTDA